MQNILETRELEKSLGISPKAAKLYMSALREGPSTLTELARAAEFSRTIVEKPFAELLELGLLYKRMKGKRLLYYPMSPQELPSLLDKKKQSLLDISRFLLQQISVPDQDLQVRWHSGISGIQNGIREFFLESKGKFFRQFENPDAFDRIDPRIGDFAVEERMRTKKPNLLIVMGMKPEHTWYRAHMEKSKEELREAIYISDEEYPFSADIAISDNIVLLFEYKTNPFALLVVNETFAQAMASIHQMVWDRYKSK